MAIIRGNINDSYERRRNQRRSNQRNDKRGRNENIDNIIMEKKILMMKESNDNDSNIKQWRNGDNDNQYQA